MTDLLVIGGGAAGLMAAGAACARGLTVTVLEHNPKARGRSCSLPARAAATSPATATCGSFCPTCGITGGSCIPACTPSRRRRPWNCSSRSACRSKPSAGGGYFPGATAPPTCWPRCAIMHAMRNLCAAALKKLVIEDGVCKGAVTDRGETLRAENTLIATGGISYPATGSDGSGYKLARQAGHTIVTPQPSLCSLISPDPACRRMMGLALRNVTLTLLCDGKELFTEQGEALFTHFGLSGPLVLSASTYIEDIAKHRYICEFDLKPALDEKTLYDRLTRDFAEQGAHSVQGALAKLLPNSMRPVAVEKWGIDPATKAAQITREQKQALVDLCKHWQVPVSALGDKEHAVITAGGVDVREVDPKTMASKLCAGLYFAGEVLDVDARTGGYNLQIAWSTAVAAAKAL